MNWQLAIEKTVTFRFDVGPSGSNVEKTIDELGTLSQLGIDVAHGRVADIATITPLEILAGEVIPAVAAL